MKCQILFSRKNKKNIISLPSAKNAQRVVKVKIRRVNCISTFQLKQEIANKQYLLDTPCKDQNTTNVQTDRHTDQQRKSRIPPLHTNTVCLRRGV